MSRRASSAIETQVLVASRRRCAICFGLLRDTTLKSGQIAHLDQDRDNNAVENLIFLCLKHHDEYDSTTRQSKGLTQDEVEVFRKELSAYLAGEKSVPWPDYPQDHRGELHATEGRRSEALPSRVDVYDRRIAIYRIVRKFIMDVIEDLDPDVDLLRTFASATDEALFVFNEEVDDYIRRLYRKVVELYGQNRRRQGLKPTEDDERSELAEESTELALWIASQLDEARLLFRKHLFLG